MNVRLLKIGVVGQNPKRRPILNLTALLLLTLCVNNARATAVTWANDAGGICSEASNWFPNQAPASGDNAIVSNSGAYPATGKFAMLPIHDLLCHYRIRTRGRFDGNFQNVFTVASNSCLPLNSSGIIVAAPPAIFPDTATARGSPGSCDRSLYLFDNALDRSATLYFSTTHFSGFKFPYPSSPHHAIRRFIPAPLVSRAGVSLVAAIFQVHTT